MKSELTERQKQLMVWCDYFKLLQNGMMARDERACDENPWSEGDMHVSTLIDVIITELKSDAMHLECGQEKYCRWDDPKDLTELPGNIDVRDGRD